MLTCAGKAFMVQALTIAEGIHEMELSDLIKEIFKQRARVQAAKEAEKKESSSLEKLKRDAVKLMEIGDIDKMSVEGVGTVYRQSSFSVRVPKDTVQKKALFEWIATEKGEDVLFAMQSINSMSLNSFYKEEMENAKEEGNWEFEIPGIEEPNVYFKLGVRKS